MFSKFSELAQKVLLNSKKEMQDLKHSYVGSEHLLLSLLKYDKDFSNKMGKQGITYKLFKDKLIEMVGYGNEDTDWFLYTPLLKKILETAVLVSKDSITKEVSTEHLIYSLFEEDEGVAIRVLESLNVDIEKQHDYYSDLLLNKKAKIKKKLIVEEFGIDLTKKAMNKELDPVIGREKEINRIMEILCRRSKNNPLLIGPAGVGKTALVEELAHLISINNVPDKLKNKRIISLSIASLVSGTKYRGEFEERITKMLNELEENDDIFLFIDEIHTIMGAGGAEGAIDAANIFKPALSRGKIRLIGATTIQEYKQTIDKDRAMERRFQKVMIDAPTDQETLNILKRIKSIFENYHNVKIDDSLLKPIVDLTNKYIYDRNQPDKSIDVLDEVCSKKTLSSNSRNIKLDIYRNELIKISNSKKESIIHQDFKQAAIIKGMEKEIKTKINNLELRKNNNKVKEITISDIYEVISSKAGFNISIENSNKQIEELEKKLNHEIVGQNHAIEELVSITKRIKLGYKKDNKPISLLFVGPTGVGKTKLASLYSKFVYNNKIIRFDMSEYRDTTSLNKILGSAPGYVGYDESNNKLEEIRNTPTGVILLDEIEKAHPSVLNLFLQILDEGKIEDNKGNIIHFNNHIIIMTSNIGFTKNDIGFTELAQKDNSKLNEFIPIELLNRIKKTIYFNKMNYNDIYCIVKRKIKDVKYQFKSKNIKIHVSGSLIEDIINKTEYETYGARKIDYVIESIVDKYVIDEILNGKKEIYINN